MIESTKPQAFANLVTNPAEAEPTPSVLDIRTAHQWARDASRKPRPVGLFDPFWMQGELCCLFADSNLGKSILAVQIADMISLRREVIYFDFELTDKQFQLRYTNEGGQLYNFDSRFLRAELRPELAVGCALDDLLIDEMERVVLERGIKVMIVDNLTYLCAESERGDAAGSLMLKLMQLKKKYGLSILVIAHTPKRIQGQPLSPNDLAGSKKLFNFFDSVFAIGRSCADDRIRYLKQLKVRQSEFKYDSDSVLKCEIVKENSFLRYDFKGTVAEKELIQQSAEVMQQKVLDLRGQGMTIRAISQQLGLSRSRVGRWVR